MDCQIFFAKKKGCARQKADCQILSQLAAVDADGVVVVVPVRRIEQHLGFRGYGRIVITRSGRNSEFGMHGQTDLVDVYTIHFCSEVLR